ncbi:MAG: hypothetical protein V1896_02095 [Candidatus Zambryskibacteria bacterium]
MDKKISLSAQIGIPIFVLPRDEPPITSFPISDLSRIEGYYCFTNVQLNYYKYSIIEWFCQAILVDLAKYASK